MTVNELIAANKITKYKLSKDSGIAYTTISDICSGRARLEKCSAETIYRISKVLGVSMENLIKPYLDKRSDFEIFKSNACHKLKELGDIAFIVNLLEKDEIRKNYEKGWHRESLYLLAMLDYVSRENNIPLCNRYDDLRKLKLQAPLFPAGVLTVAAVTKNRGIKEQAIKEAIPEFMRFNIVENEVRNVI